MSIVLLSISSSSSCSVRMARAWSASSCSTQTIRQRLRASHFMSQKNDSEEYSTAVKALLGNVINRASRTLSTKSSSDRTIPQDDIPIAAAEPKLRLWDEPGSSYCGNPAVTPTALAHSQWSHILRPGIDSAIDATCGNGHDSTYIAKLLFSNNNNAGSADTKTSELVCVDVQKEACDATRDRLLQWMDPITFEEHVQIVHVSHSPLPRPRNDTSVGLVVWNLGYLPNSNEREIFTQMESTIASIVDAALLVRVGGMLSIASYPKTNPTENYAVQSLMEAMALLSSKETDWRQYVAELGSMVDTDTNTENDDSFAVRNIVQAGMNNIVDRSTNGKLSWRVFHHKVLGRPLSPILYTATRIK